MVPAIVALSILVAALGASPGFAQDATPDGERGRFSFTQVAGGLLRLDTRTGQVSLCSRENAGWACRAVPDERAALEGEIARLQGENAMLKKEMIARGVPLPGGLTRGQNGEPKIELRLPSDAEINRVMAFIEKVWRRLVEIVQSTAKKPDNKS